jgi:hypothetical protein
MNNLLKKIKEIPLQILSRPFLGVYFVLIIFMSLFELKPILDFGGIESKKIQRSGILTEDTPDTTSRLWGKEGEDFDPASRLPDVSWAGYHNGEESPPHIPVVTNAADFGAIPDDSSDDTQALQAMINATTSGAALIPEGIYIISRPLRITHSNTVLRGQGPAKTILTPVVPLDDLTGESGYDSNYGRTAYIEIVPENQWPAFTHRNKMRNLRGPRRITRVTKDASKGSRSIIVEDTRDLNTGQEILLYMWNPPNNSLGFYLYGNLGCLNDERQAFWDRRDGDWICQIATLDGNTIILSRTLPFDVKREWQAEIWEYSPLLQESGVENLTIDFPENSYGGHHYEKGWHAIWLGWTDNCWIRNVEILDADRGVEVTYSVRSYVTEVTLDAPDRGRMPASGHYGISVGSFTQDALVEDCTLKSEFVHNLSVGTLVSGNVYSRIRTKTGALDHHGGAPFNNVFTEIEITSSASNLFTSGGNRKDEPNAGIGSTFWNIYLSPTAVGDFPNSSQSHRFPVQNLIGLDVWQTNRSKEGQWIERRVTHPKNIYEAQLAKRLAK